MNNLQKLTLNKHNLVLTSFIIEDFESQHDASRMQLISHGQGVFKRQD